MKVSLIADFDIAVGFKLAGLKEVYAVTDGKQAEEIINKLTKNAEIGIIVITESLANQIRQHIKEELYERLSPIIVEIPDKKGVPTAMEFIKDVVKRTIGIELLIG
jgi:V/A-type H+-transporting ATPase subunit F